MQGDSHVILETADGLSYASLRRRPVPRTDRYAIGQSLREKVPRSALGDWSPAPDRRDPVEQIVETHADRLPWLIAVRIGRMVSSPYAFLRGTAGSWRPTSQSCRPPASCR